MRHFKSAYQTIGRCSAFLGVGLCLLGLQSNCNGQQNIDRADFYINLNECVNCQMFLKNHLSNLENADTLYLHLDESARNFGTKVIRTKGIDPSLFDRTFYEALLKDNHGNFESYIVRSYQGKRDTISVATPLFIDGSDVVVVESPQNTMSSGIECDETSDRVFPYYTDNKFILIDYLLNATYRYRTLENKIASCNSDVFNVEGNYPFYKNYILQCGWSLDMTNALSVLLTQIGKANPTVIGTGIKDGDFVGVIAVPYVFGLGDDTLVSTITILQTIGGDVLGAFEVGTELGLKSKLHQLGYVFDSSEGLVFQNDTVVAPLFRENEEYRAGQKFIGRFVKDENGIYSFSGFAEFELPVDVASKWLSLRFNRSLMHFKDLPYFYDLKTKKRFELRIPLYENQSFKLHDVAKDPKNINLYKICYQIDSILYFSEYDAESDLNAIFWEEPIELTEYPIVQRDGVFVLQEGGPKLPYTYLPFE